MSKQQTMHVKAYAKLIERNEKTVYKMIKDGMLLTHKEQGKIQIMVDKNLIKILERTQLALEECKTMLLSIDEASKTLRQPSKNKTKPLPKKSSVKMKKTIKTKPLKKSLKKSTKPLKKRVRKVLTKSTKRFK